MTKAIITSLIGNYRLGDIISSEKSDDKNVTVVDNDLIWFYIDSGFALEVPDGKNDSKPAGVPEDVVESGSSDEDSKQSWDGFRSDS